MDTPLCDIAMSLYSYAAFKCLRKVLYAQADLPRQGDESEVGVQVCVHLFDDPLQSCRGPVAVHATAGGHAAWRDIRRLH